MRKVAVFAVSLIMLLGLVGAGSGILGAQAAGTGTGPTVTVWPPVVEINKNTNLVILGSGFEPGEELYILLRAAGGTTSNIKDFLKPVPDKGVPVDEQGNFACLFNLGRLERLQAEGVYSFVITDLSYETLASAPIGFADPDGRSRAGIYPRGAPNYAENPDDPRPLPWVEPFFDYPERP